MLSHLIQFVLSLLSCAVLFVGLGALTRQRVGDVFSGLGVVLAAVTMLLLAASGCAPHVVEGPEPVVDLRRPDLRMSHHDAGPLVPLDSCPGHEMSVLGNPRYKPGDLDWQSRLSRLAGVACAGLPGGYTLEAKHGAWNATAPGPPPGPGYTFLETHRPELQETWFYEAGRLVSIFTIDRTVPGCGLVWYGKELFTWRGANGMRTCIPEPT